MSSLTKRFLVGFGIVAALCVIWGTAVDFNLVRLIFKPIPVLCIAVWVYIGKKDSYDIQIFRGLVLCALGDLLLEVGEKTFLAGVLAFLFGQLFYASAFLRHTRTLRLPYAIPFALWGILVYSLLMPYLGPMTVPVAIYIVVICVTMWRAVAMKKWTAGLGAVLFGLSDSLLAINRWYGPVPAEAYIIIHLYWAGQVGIGKSVEG
jgi:alkenylglycerophosphocholine/alkenylglycerophosphoethanolamine hydrolase